MVNKDSGAVVLSDVNDDMVARESLVALSESRPTFDAVNTDGFESLYGPGAPRAARGC